MTNNADVAIVGGGIVGCALARELAGRGLRVTVIERGEPGSEASGAAAGMLAPQAEGLPAGPLFDLALESRGLYPKWTEELARETGIDAGYRRCGILRCAFSGGGDKWDWYAWQRERGLSLERLDGEAVSALTRGKVSKEVQDAIFFSEDGVVDNSRLTRALWIAAERRGVTFEIGRTVRSVLARGGRCAGVRIEDGVIEAPRVVNAAGAWAPFDPEFPVPVEPVRGQIVEVRPPAPDLPVVVWSEDVYVVPRGDVWLLGSTMEHVGFEKRVTAGAVQRLLAAAARLLPSLESATFSRVWSGLRPGTADELPVLGPGRLPGLFFATGHYRNGILLAPLTALAVADEITGRGSRDLSPFSIERFSERPP